MTVSAIMNVIKRLERIFVCQDGPEVTVPPRFQDLKIVLQVKILTLDVLRILLADLLKKFCFTLLGDINVAYWKEI